MSKRSVRIAENTAGCRYEVCRLVKVASITHYLEKCYKLMNVRPAGSNSNESRSSSSSSSSIRSIPLYNILSATYLKSVLTIDFAEQIGKSKVRPASLRYPATQQSKESGADVVHSVQRWVDQLFRAAYSGSQLYKHIKVLVNPFGGKGLAEKLYERDIAPIFAAAGCVVDVERTQRRGHAVEIAKELDIQSWNVVACCSGDGLPHEVFNGLGQRPDAKLALGKVAVTCLPCGSGNGLCLNLNGTSSASLAALSVVKGKRMPLDLVSITQGDRRTLSFLSQTVGSIADADLGTEHLRWMGEARFTYGVLKAIVGKRTRPCDVAMHVRMDDKEVIKKEYGLERENLKKYEKVKDVKAEDDNELMGAEKVVHVEENGLPALRFGTVNEQLQSSMPVVLHKELGTFWAGNMSFMSADANVFPAALPSDGAMDVVLMNGTISRLEAVQNLLAVEKGTFFDRKSVRYVKAEAVRVVPHGWEENRKKRTTGVDGKANHDAKAGGNISIDGEKFPFEPFQAEVHRGLGTVLSRSGTLYETDGLG